VSGLRSLAGAAAVVLASTAGVAVADGVAAAYPSSTVTLTGHGYGHGRGMGQWGAFGYAYAGTTWQQIVQHYYAGAAPALTTPQQEGLGVRVALTENNGNDVFVVSASPYSVNGIPIAAGRAVWMHQAAGAWTLSQAAGCAGPTWTQFASGAVTPTAVPARNSTIGDPNSATLAMQLCQAGGNLYVRGAIEALYNSSGAARTVNYLPLEEYVSGVVPNESPAYWGTLGAAGPQGQAWGYQELETQAVAARSYVMAALGSYGGYADTCDLTCQTYRGLANESPLTDQATLDTLGYVMEVGGNQVPLTTEYSASTGGYTAPGNFPAAPDAGDAVCPPGVNGACNPDHTWKASVPVSTIEAAWPQLGSLVSVTVTARNGFGDWGGRVTSMTLRGTAQSVVVTGDQFAAACNLRSNWFTLTTTLPAPAVAIAATPDTLGYWINASDGSVVGFGDAASYGSMAGIPLARPVVGMTPTPDGRGYWEVATDGGIFSFGDARFFGSTGSIHLNQPIVGMSRTPTGLGYWLVAADGGIFAYGDARFFGSTGSIHLNQPIVGMATTHDGQGYWLVASDGGIFAFGDATFYGSMGAHPLNRPIVGMAAAPGATGYWMVASDGGIFSFGTALFHGSAGGTPLVAPIVGMTRTSSGQGYWMAAADGGVFTYGDARFYGSAAG
jgi:SpoIID/LytB domain protein